MAAVSWVGEWGQQVGGAGDAPHLDQEETHLDMLDAVAKIIMLPHPPFFCLFYHYYSDEFTPPKIFHECLTLKIMSTPYG